jgi:membrane protease YdiL (CAAX protease family)
VPVFLPTFEGLVLASGIVAWIWLVTQWRARRDVLPFEPRRLVPWQGADVLLIVATYLLVGFICFSAALRWSGTSIPKTGELPSPQYTTVELASNLAASIITFLAAIAMLWARWRVSLAELGFDRSHIAGDLKTGAIAFALVAPVVYGIQAAFTQFIPYEHPLISAAQGHVVLVGISGIVVAPIFEEFMFRGVLQGWLEKLEAAVVSHRRSREPSDVSAASTIESVDRPLGAMPIIASSLLFALMHLGQGPAPIALFVFSLVLGFLYRQTHRLWPSMVVHCLLNAVTIVILFAGGES